MTFQSSRPSLSALANTVSTKNTVDWERAADTLVDSDSDVFLIFDCCDAGAINNERFMARRHPFQFLGACDSNERTPAPGHMSFTASLTWALNKLSTRDSFDTSQLIDTITKAPNFPMTQQPYFTRNSGSRIVLSRMPIHTFDSGKALQLVDSLRRRFIELHMDLRTTAAEYAWLVHGHEQPILFRGVEFDPGGTC